KSIRALHTSSLDNGYAAKPWSRTSPAECWMHAWGWLLLVAVWGSPTPRPTRQPTPRPTRQPTPRPTHQPTRQPTAVPSPLPSAAPTAWNCTEAVARATCGADLERFCNATNTTEARAGLAAASRCSDDDGDDDAAPTDADTFATAALWVLGGVVLLTILFGGFCIVHAARRREERRQFSAEEACRAGVYWTPRGDDEALRIAR
ncbi:unnamed protein product, partial [Pelagomonas calceolata]